jgi:ribosomal protein L4
MVCVHIDNLICLYPVANSRQPTAADIKRKNANFANRAQLGKRTARPARINTKRSTGTWVLIAMGFLLVGGSEFAPSVTSHAPFHMSPGRKAMSYELLD